MLIVLPPSEGKDPPRRGRPLDLSSLSFPDLEPARSAALDALVALCSGSTTDAARALDLGGTQEHLVVRNATLRTAPTARADRVYSGVLFEALDPAALSPAAKRRAATRLAVTSALFGLVRTVDRIPAYRLSAGTTLPGLGSMTRHWSRHLPPVAEAVAGDGLVVDLRSGAYLPFWRPARTVRVRVVHERSGRRSVVSHLNKATKGRLVRDLLEDGSQLRRPEGLAALLGDLGWTVERTAAGIDVVVSEL